MVETNHVIKFNGFAMLKMTCIEVGVSCALMNLKMSIYLIFLGQAPSVSHTNNVEVPSAVCYIQYDTYQVKYACPTG